MFVKTLQLRRIHILEQERQVLTSGLQALERARDWFNSQLGDVQERIKSFGKSNSGSNVICPLYLTKFLSFDCFFFYFYLSKDYSTEAHQERLGFKISRIEEVSRQLIMLIENADRGFPAHMNLALADRNKVAKTPGDGVDENNEEEVNRILRRLKSQNHQLTEVFILGMEIFKEKLLMLDYILLGGWSKKRAHYYARERKEFFNTRTFPSKKSNKQPPYWWSPFATR